MADVHKKLLESLSEQLRPNTHPVGKERNLLETTELEPIFLGETKSTPNFTMKKSDLYQLNQSFRCRFEIFIT